MGKLILLALLLGAFTIQLLRNVAKDSAYLKEKI